MIKKLLLSLMLLTVSSKANSISDSFSIIDDSWAYHDKLPTLAITSILLAGVVEGNNTRIGKTIFKSIDSLIIGGVITQVGKYSFGRVRPYQETSTLNGWFNPGHHSFPSGHTSSMTSIITPFIFEYAKEEPLVNLLWALPIHQAMGRVNDKKHHVTDVIAGFAIGVFSGWIATDLDTPLTLSWKEGGVYGGLEWKF